MQHYWSPWYPWVLDFPGPPQRQGGSKATATRGESPQSKEDAEKVETLLVKWLRMISGYENGDEQWQWDEPLALVNG